MGTSKKKSIGQLESAEFFFREIPLYSPISLACEGNKEIYQSIASPDKTLDCYCSGCKASSIFQPEKKRVQIIGDAGKVGSNTVTASQPNSFKFKPIENITFSCTRDSSHQLRFIVKCDGENFWKIGQDPQLIELEKSTLAKYQKVLGEERHKELVRAVGLSAHGVGIGAFVYLRRIFESLIEEAHQKETSNSDWDEKKYQNHRVTEKIAMLEHQLPEFLIENAKLYGILSKGIHELTENECLEYFTIVRSGIELILDEILQQKEQRIKQAEITKSISDLNSRHS